MLIDSNISFGLSDRDIATISGILQKYPEVTEVFIFGSRAKGSNKTYSDIDMAVMNENVSDKTILRIKSDLADSTLPYNVDLLYYPSLTHTDLKEHIDRVGLLLYKKAKAD